jgi:hypothetical protein
MYVHHDDNMRERAIEQATSTNPKSRDGLLPLHHANQGDVGEVGVVKQQRSDGVSPPIFTIPPLFCVLWCAMLPDREDGCIYRHF